MHLKKAFLGLVAIGIGTYAYAQAPEDVGALGLRLDAELFDSYNKCDLDRFGKLLAQDVEFFDDRDGLMVGRKPVVDSVKEYICNKVRRELIPGSLHSYPMEHYGLVQMGEHRFCEIGTNKCTGKGQFVHLWRKSGSTWEATRIISYDHQPL